jgi:hypothetical protein
LYCCVPHTRSCPHPYTYPAAQQRHVPVLAKVSTRHRSTTALPCTCALASAHSRSTSGSQCVNTPTSYLHTHTHTLFVRCTAGKSRSQFDVGSRRQHTSGSQCVNTPTSYLRTHSTWVHSRQGSGVSALKALPSAHSWVQFRVHNAATHLHHICKQCSQWYKQSQDSLSKVLNQLLRHTSPHHSPAVQTHSHATHANIPHAVQCSKLV